MDNPLSESYIDELLHYASENYDPRKAHEYYLRNRELKGRNSTKGLNAKQREGWQYAQAQIHERTKKKIESARIAEKNSIEQARAKTSEFRQQFAEKLKQFAEQLSQQHAYNSEVISNNAKKQRQAIAEKLTADISAIPEVPKNLPKSQREKLLAERSEKISKLRGKAVEDRKAIDAAVTDARTSEQTDVKNARKDASDNAAQTRAQVADQLKAMVAQYVEKYKASKVQITSESEATLDKEFKNIKTKVR